MSSPLQIGQVITATRTFSQADFNRFAILSGDDNPIHVDPEFSARTRFGKTVCHGMLLYGVICGVLSNHFPGATQLEQEMMFAAPTFVDEEVTLRLEVIETELENGLARLSVVLTKPNGETACEGQTLIKWQAV